ncbi:hypothetical protein GA0070623_5277 [Micromonospora rifamycinica]|uniref:Uncharacterized protein n=1 Tax=Micromonospora rifamycinica TaxID=291594 RepID=A0A1C5KDV5_9ACTN|nr:hypothetical protein GA0070623_5277 [Micromonospora rifamycinica]
MTGYYEPASAEHYGAKMKERGQVRLRGDQVVGYFA